MGTYPRTTLPIYQSGEAPAGLATRRQLRAEGLSAAGLETAAWLAYCPYHYCCPLYRREEARPVRALTAAQAAALAEGRKLAGTRPCKRCQTARVPKWDAYGDGSAYCDECAEIRRREAAERHAAMLKQDHDAAVQWAAGCLADERTVYLDTETTGLYEGSWIVEIAILDYQGRELVNTLVNPQDEIPDAAARIHGITDADVSDAPVFADIWPDIEKAVEGKRVVIYNAAFDTAMLLFELDRMWTAAERQFGPRRDRWDRHPAALAQAKRITAGAECAMNRYAEHEGTWDDYHHDYRWLPLNGGHRAAGDCRAVLDLMRTMAGVPAPEAELSPAGPWDGPVPSQPEETAS